MHDVSTGQLPDHSTLQTVNKDAFSNQEMFIMTEMGECTLAKMPLFKYVAHILKMK